MKQLSSIASAVALTVGLFAASQASAATICANCLYSGSGATFLGAHNPNAGDSSGFRHDGIVVPPAPSGPTPPLFFNDFWIFDLFPVGGTAQVNANFLPLSSAFSNFRVRLFNATGTVCSNGIGSSTGGLLTGYCPTVMQGALLGSSVPAGSGADLFPVSLLSAGRYMFVVDGFANYLGNNGDGSRRTAEYSGQIRVDVIPEPTTLALAGLALVGIAVSARRNRKA